MKLTVKKHSQLELEMFFLAHTFGIIMQQNRNRKVSKCRLLLTEKKKKTVNIVIGYANVFEERNEK